MKRLLNVLAVITCTMFFAACEYYDHAITDHEDRFELFENVYLKNVNGQIEGINASVDQFETVDSVLQVVTDSLATVTEELQGLLDTNNAADAATKQAIETEIANVNALIAALQGQDAELDHKINGLNTYVDSEISAIKDWTNVTFATLEQYAGIQTEIATIKALIETYKEEFTTAYAKAIEEAFTAIEEAFAVSEASMKVWVNATLAEGYYDIATIDGMLKALETKSISADAALAEQIATQQAALEQAKKDLTTAYEVAIKEAIEKNNGKITEEIADAVKKAQDALQNRIDAITAEINAIKAEIALIKESIASIDTQIANINASLGQLEETDAALQTLIESFEVEAENLQNQLEANSAADAATKKALEEEIANINALIEVLQNKDAELDQKIDELSAYVDGEIATNKNWASATFATLEQYAGIQTEIAGIKALIETYKNEFTAAYDQAIEEAITVIQEAFAKSEASMKAWVNTTLANSYYDIATIDAILTTLDSKFTDANADLTEQITAQQTALEQAKKDLTTAYEAAIKETIEKNNGKINKEIANAVKEAQDALQNQIDDITAEITAIKTEIALIKESIASINTQITNINASIGQFEEMDAALQTLIENLEAEAEELQNQLEANSAADAATKKALEEEIDNINTLIEALQNKDAELDQKIDELSVYVENKISATKDWTSATFATLEQYAGVQIEIADIKALIETYKNEFKTACTEAIEEAITAIEEAFAKSEASMKAWVNATLAEGYYDIATIDGMLEALEIKLAGADANLAEQIAAQQVALEQAKEDLTEAYKKAIKEAIEENNGKISEEIAKAVKAATDDLEAKMAVINSEIESIKAEITAIKESIASINTQIANINASLGQLEEMDAALQTLIESLEAEAEELQNQLEANSAADAATKKALEEEIDNINTLIEALQNKDAELDQKIDELSVYVENEISATKDWTSATFATLEQYAGVQTEIADIKALIETYKNELTAAYTTAIEEAIITSETSMQVWVNATLAEGYYDIATIDGMLEALETKLAGADTNLAEQIATQQAALEQAKEELTIAYEAAIKVAIEENNGKINKEIASAVKKAQDELQAQIDDITTEIYAIWDEIEAIKGAIASINTQIDNINISLGQLEEMDAALQTLIENLEAEAEELQNQLEANSAADAATKKALEEKIDNINTLIEALQNQDAELDQKIDELSVYVENEISVTKDWASATFATLEQYAETQTEIEAIKALVETYKNEFIADNTRAIEEAIAACEISMQAWVNETLAEGYYDIATIDNKLAALANAANDYTDHQLNRAIASQQTALEQSKAELTVAYQRAIQEAITNNNGIINSNFEAQITAAKADLQNQIDAISAEIASIEDRLATLEEKISALETRIQSIRFIPEYSDGKVVFNSKLTSTLLTFMLSPSEAASAIAQVYQNNSSIITAYISRTQTRTRAIDAPTTLNITSVSGDNNGLLAIGIDLSTLPANYWNNASEANIFVRITDGNNDIISEMIPTSCVAFSVEGVDLGLSVKWATCNVGATAPEEYGTYFAWGETKGKATYSWATYEWCNGTENTITKYCTNSAQGTVDNASVLTLEDDAAHIMWGESWRMPTKEEMNELITRCTWEWTSINGINGYKVSGNGNYIFLPATGYYSENRVSDRGSYGSYWSSTKTANNSNAACVLELYSRAKYLEESFYKRYYGLPIRPVTE